MKAGRVGGLPKLSTLVSGVASCDYLFLGNLAEIVILLSVSSPSSQQVGELSISLCVFLYPANIRGLNEGYNSLAP